MTGIRRSTAPRDFPPVLHQEIQRIEVVIARTRLFIQRKRNERGFERPVKLAEDLLLGRLRYHDEAMKLREDLKAGTRHPHLLWLDLRKWEQIAIISEDLNLKLHTLYKELWGRGPWGFPLAGDFLELPFEYFGGYLTDFLVDDDDISHPVASDWPDDEEDPNDEAA